MKLTLMKKIGFAVCLGMSISASMLATAQAKDCAWYEFEDQCSPEPGEQ